MKRSDRFTRRDEIILLLEQNPGWHKTSWIRGRMCMQAQAVSKLLHDLLDDGLVEYEEIDFIDYQHAGIITRPVPANYKKPRQWRLKDA